MQQFRGTSEPLVDFVSGAPTSKRQIQQALKQYHDAVRDEAAQAAVGHPAERLLSYLNAQSPRSLTHRLKQTEVAVMSKIEAMPDGPARDSFYRILSTAVENAVMIYRPVENSSRIFAEGTSIHGLPRELRLLALDGDVFLDLKACQLAVVSAIWPVPRPREMLESGTNFWAYILDRMELSAPFKDVVKPAIYSVLFGMKERHLREWLAARVTEDAADRFLSDPIVRELLKRREQIQGQIRREGGAYDAFSAWLAVTPDRKPHQVACSVVQSYELRIMLAMLPEILENPNVHLHSWLHDGCAISCKHRWQEEEIVRRIESALNAEASQLGIPTWVEVTR